MCWPGCVRIRLGHLGPRISEPRTKRLDAKHALFRRATGARRHGPTFSQACIYFPGIHSVPSHPVISAQENVHTFRGKERYHTNHGLGGNHLLSAHSNLEAPQRHRRRGGGKRCFLAPKIHLIELLLAVKAPALQLCFRIPFQPPQGNFVTHESKRFLGRFWSPVTRASLPQASSSAIAQRDFGGQS